MKSILLPTKQLKNTNKSTDGVDIERNDTLTFKVDSRNSVASDVVVVERARIDSDLLFCVDSEPNVTLCHETNNHNNKGYIASKKAVLTTTTAAQVIRNCSVGASEKLKRVSSDISNNSKSLSSKYGGDNDEQQTTIKKNSSDYTITTVDVQHLNPTTTTENSPLLLLGGSNNNFDNTNDGSAKQKFLNIKKNGATLIFQKKNSSTQKYIRSVEYPELDNLKKRRSLQWSNSGSVIGDKLKNRHSWYEPRFPIVIKEELFDRPDPNINQSTNDDNLAELRNNGSSSTLCPAVVTYRDNSGSMGSDYVPENCLKTNDIATLSASTGAVPRRWRFEQFLKNLVGKKSKEIVTTQQQQSATTTAQKINKSPSEHSLFQDQQNSINCSQTSLNRVKLLNKSTTSLNSTSAIVQQKLWSVVPLLSQKDGHSCSSLLIDNTTNQQHHGVMRKCETVLALTHEPVHRTSTASTSVTTTKRSHSKSISSLLEPIKPLNRLRNSRSCYINNHHSNSSTAQTQCSRCSSLLSLAAVGGSNYSLNTTNSSFVLSNKKSISNHNNTNDHHRHSLRRHSNTNAVSLLDGDNLIDSISNSSNNLIANDYNEIELYASSSKIASMLNVRTVNTVNNQQQQVPMTLKFSCKLCLAEYTTHDKITKITSCGCSFCTECMKAYVEFEITAGAYEVSCPDAQCKSQGVVSIDEISLLAESSLVEKHYRYRLNREVELDKHRTWCPKAGCETICLVGPLDSSASSPVQPSSSAILLVPRAVHCATCEMDFCSGCKKPWHPLMTCEENTRRLAAFGRSDSLLIFDNDLIKCCPMCAVPIEKDEGCAQMMCKKCRHVFCWYCLASLDDDFLLRHYDKGPCKNKLGHSRISVFCHRAQVISIFAGFGILLLVASPLLLLAAPCIVCCKCRICNSSKLEEQDDEAIALNR